ncbi:MAG: hypothetical protein HC923_02155 [Myxococcales bacterium]|nr:hypothetical protein [Myxococcales bacterium]
MVLEGPSIVENAVIREHTILAGHTELRDAVLDGGLLLNLRHRARVPRLDTLMADALRAPRDRPNWRERTLAAVLFAAGLPLRTSRARGSRTLRSFQGLELREGEDGPLWLRRHDWYREVVRGRMRLWGPLPRSAEQLDALDPEWRASLESVQPGVFAYSDLHGAHRADTEIEPIHAVFQANSPRDAMNVVFKENLTRLLALKPEEPDGGA